MKELRLSKREYDVLKRLAMPNIDIADELGLKESYINNVAHRICLKLGVSTRTGAVIQAVKRRLIDIYNFIL